MKKNSPAKVNSEDRWIDVHSDSEMEKYGIYRAKVVKPRDPNVWSRTPYERYVLKNVRKLKGNTHFMTIPKKIIPCYSKLVIYLKKNKKYPKTTLSRMCWQHEIPEILLNYKSNKSSNSLVAKYSFNGITYMPNEIPYWI